MHLRISLQEGLLLACMWHASEMSFKSSLSAQQFYNTSYSRKTTVCYGGIHLNLHIHNVLLTRSCHVYILRMPVG